MLSAQLQEKQEAFAAAAPEEKQRDFDWGVEQVAQMGVLDSALKVGDTAPDFTLPNAFGNDVNLSDKLVEGSVVIVWYRGSWCPYCNIQLQHLQRHADDFAAAGASIIAVSPELPEKGFTMQDKLALKFEVLSDQGNTVAKDYGVAYTLPEKIAGYLNAAFDLEAANGDDSNVLPLAASYVIAPSGEITYAYLDADYRKRAETADLLAAVQALNTKEE